ncbi:acetyl-CoA carboxylase biotin carboxyl carrier protein [Oceanobacillus massiliensis]|uniref:acetyl-CoA carboxylase biotin carboxyl carrier protein n=1 Tax=Oceanobacillus massiliensis TaxID=1465765 RepID=UPI000288CE9F|nr:acetyl-CoA carboxylase biotin carboxyl carrier protein [Oceanobacillus massiliensis]
MLKVQEIREIIKLIDQSSITEFTYETNGTSVTMKKSGNESAKASASITAEEMNQQFISIDESPQVQESPVQPQASTGSAVDDKADNNPDYDYEIVSPMVGTFYASSTPESEPYVSKGSSVAPNTVVCIVEAMKLFNEIEAEVSGEIVEIIAENGELVEYGQPLFRVKKK